METRVRLRETRDDDLLIFFEQQLDPTANEVAAFGALDPASRDAFDTHWARIRGDDTILIRTVLVGDQVAGHIESFVRLGLREVSYWIGRDFWGQGFATCALQLLLDEVSERPLHARVAKDNAASIRVLEKCGFRVCGEDVAFSHARGKKVEEYLLVLE